MEPNTGNINKKSRYRIGLSGLMDTLAVKFQLIFLNPKKALNQESRLKIGSYIDLDSGLKFLEIGPCAGTTTAAHFCSLKADLTLFDLWAYYKQWFVLKKANPNLKIVIGNADNTLPFLSKTFDCCVHMGTFCYFDNPQNALSEVFRVLNPGGYLFISNVDGMETHAGKSGRLDVANMPNFQSMSEFVDGLEKAGFEVNETLEYGLCPPHFAALYDYFVKFFYFNGRLYNWLRSRYPEENAFLGAVARKPVKSLPIEG